MPGLERSGGTALLRRKVLSPTQRKKTTTNRTGVRAREAEFVVVLFFLASLDKFDGTAEPTGPPPEPGPSTI
jgi:hypothetical protein